MDVNDFYVAAQDYGFTDLSNATLLRALQGTVDAVERLRPWPFLEASATLTFAGSTELPATAPPRIRAVLRASIIGTGARLRPVRVDDFEDWAKGDYAKDGTPRIYVMRAGVLEFWPRPAATDTVKLRYIQFSPRMADATLEAAILVPARHHEVLLFGMLRRLYDQQDDPELALTMAQQYQQLVAEMVEDLTKQQYDEPEFIHVTDVEDYF